MDNNKNKIYYFKKKILQFESNNTFLSDADFLNLFQGFLKLIINTTEKRCELKYRNRIAQLEKEIILLSGDNTNTLKRL